MLEMAVEIAAQDPNYEEMVFKFIEHFYFIALAMNQPGDEGMWDEEDGFYYDILRLPDGRTQRLKVRSMVGLLPYGQQLCRRMATGTNSRPLDMLERIRGFPNSKQAYTLQVRTIMVKLIAASWHL